MKRMYVSFAVILTNTFLLIVGIDILLYGYICYRDRHNNPISRYSIKQLLKAYPGWSANDLDALENPVWSGMRFAYDPITQFRVLPMTSKYLNVEANGFRRGATSLPWPPDKAAFNVFVFGGSTTFGTGVPDWDTIPSALQGALREGTNSRTVNVYNMGRPGFSSTGEMLIFISLLGQDIIPDEAVFIDGLNDSLNSTKQLAGVFFGQSLGDLIDRSQDTGGYFVLGLQQMSLGKAMTVLVDEVGKISGSKRVSSDTVGDEVMQSWLARKKFIEKVAAAYKIKTCFVWQPVPVYNYDLQYDIARAGVLKEAPYDSVRAVYPVAARLYSHGYFGSDSLYLADIQKNQNVNLYVDAYHYTASFIRDIAGRIAAFMLRTGALTAAQ
jgi:hypothetical protein